MKKKPTKKTAKKVSQATLTRRRNKMFGLKVKADETRNANLKQELHEQELHDLSRQHKMQVEDMSRLFKLHQQDWDIERKRLQEIETSTKKKFDEERALAYKTMELEFRGKVIEEVNKVRVEYDAKLIKSSEENYEKLKTALSKLHEEGNAQTKFTEQIALKMMGSLRPQTQAKLIGNE